MVVFFDKNHNSAKDTDEPGVQDRVLVSQDLSCPPTNEQVITRGDTDPSGVALFKNLKPGKYCVGYAGVRGLTTSLTREVFVSSEQTVVVGYGLSEN